MRIGAGGAEGQKRPHRPPLKQAPLNLRPVFIQTMQEADEKAAKVFPDAPGVLLQQRVPCKGIALGTPQLRCGLPERPFTVCLRRKMRAQRDSGVDAAKVLLQHRLYCRLCQILQPLKQEAFSQHGRLPHGNAGLRPDCPYLLLCVREEKGIQIFRPLLRTFPLSVFFRFFYGFLHHGFPPASPVCSASRREAQVISPRLRKVSTSLLHFCPLSSQTVSSVR